MHVPASVSGARRRLALPAPLRGRMQLPGGRPAATAAASLAGLLVLFGVILVFTPIAHPRTTVIDGVTGPSEERIVRLLEDAAAKQSTFAVNEDALLRAVAAYPEVSGVEVDAHPPFRVEVRAIMRPPVARLDIAGRAFVVAGDGTILQRAAEADVPKLEVATGTVRLHDGRVVGGRAALQVLAGAPASLLAIARTVRSTQAGVEVEMARGPRLIFGTADGAADKWAAAAAVIADGSAQGATYIDLRVPSRPAVGGLGGSKSATASAPPQLTPTQTATGGAPTAAAATVAPQSTEPGAGDAATEGPSGATNAAGGTPTQPSAPAPAAPASPATGTAPSAGTGTSTGAPAAADAGGGAAIGATP